VELDPEQKPQLQLGQRVLINDAELKTPLSAVVVGWDIGCSENSDWKAANACAELKQVRSTCMKSPAQGAGSCSEACHRPMFCAVTGLSLACVLCWEAVCCSAVGACPPRVPRSELSSTQLRRVMHWRHAPASASTVFGSARNVLRSRALLAAPRTLHRSRL
jgi:hypothetical protein